MYFPFPIHRRSGVFEIVISTKHSEPTGSARWWHFWQCESCDSPAAETRHHLLEAAFDEIHRTGFQAASLHRILRRTGLTKGALYHHFPNKLALGYAVVDELLGPYLEQNWLAPLRSATDPVEKMKELLLENARRMEDRDIALGCPLNNLAQEMAPVDAGFQTRILGLFDAWRDGIATALAAGQTAGLVREDINPRQASSVILATMEGCIGLAKAAQSIDVLRECGAGLIEYLDSLKAGDRETRT
jgi:AcrR family transcriptional regulator